MDSVDFRLASDGPRHAILQTVLLRLEDTGTTVKAGGLYGFRITAMYAPPNIGNR